MPLKALKNRIIKARSSEIRLGFVPLVDCAPLVVAHELGMFSKRGLKVSLQREFGWAAVRDKLLFGELDAAHAAGGLSLAMTLGIGSVPTPMLTGLVLSSNGNPIVLNNELADLFNQSTEVFAKHIRSKQFKQKIVLGVVSLTSSHYFILGKWLSGLGLDIRNDVQIAVLPPPQMAQNLAAGHIQGFCSGAPWGSVTVDQGLGECVAVSAEIFPDHPEKVLLVPQSFEVDRSDEHSLIREALLEACEYCETESNMVKVAEMISGPSYVKCSSELILKCLKGPFVFKKGNERSVSHFLRFFGESCNAPTVEKADWLMTEMESYGLVQGMIVNRFDLLKSIFREDLYQKSLENKKIEKPIQETSKILAPPPTTGGVQYRWA